MKHIKLVNILEYNHTFYFLYFYLGSFLINLIKNFIKPDDKIILFVSLGGRNFSDSPRAIYNRMIADERFSDMKLVWAFLDPSKYKLEKGKAIKIDSINYFITALKARVWITNSSMERGLSFKGKHTFCLNTWHGTPIKKMGEDIAVKNEAFKTKSINKTDVETAQSQFEADVFAKAFGLPIEKLQVVGYPRNDELAHYTDEQRASFRSKLNIPSNKKAILYAPTYREYERDRNESCILSSPIDINKWRKILSDKYVLLIRAHYEITKMMKIENDSFVHNVSDYPSLNELMIASDLLISDYSSIIFDYSIMDKPILTFCYDYERYSSERGMYFDIRKELHSDNNNEDDLIKSIETLDFSTSIETTKKFRNKYVSDFGHATDKVLDIISKELSK